jgi:hypothetical protein
MNWFSVCALAEKKKNPEYNTTEPYSMWSYVPENNMFNRNMSGIYGG